MENTKMSDIPYSFSFETLGNSLDSFLSDVSSRAVSAMPRPEYVKTTVRNAVPRISGNFNVDLTETDDALIITCDLPGFTKEDVSVKLIDGRTVVIHTAVCTESLSAGVYHLRERRSASGKRIIRLPEEVTAEGAKAVFRHGVLELVLLKVQPDEGESIPVEYTLSPPPSLFHFFRYLPQSMKKTYMSTDTIIEILWIKDRKSCW